MASQKYGCRARVRETGGGGEGRMYKDAKRFFESFKGKPYIEKRKDVQEFSKKKTPSPEPSRPLPPTHTHTHTMQKTTTPNHAILYLLLNTMQMQYKNNTDRRL